MYPWGRPDLKVAVASDGTYRLEAVPTSIDEFILFDGAPFPTGRAELVVLELEGGAENRVGDRYGGGATPPDPSLLMPLAASVLATVTVEGGATVVYPSFTVAGTEHQSLIAASGNQLTIYPLPAGSWDVSARLPGFSGAQASIDAAPGLTMDAPLYLLIDGSAPAPGCAALPGCDGGLICNVTDGRCYP